MSFQLAHPKGGAQGVPRVVEKPLAAGQAGNTGALMLADASDNWAECGADPAAIGGVALSGFGADAGGFNILGKKEFPPGKLECFALEGLEFTAKYVGALPAANGGSFGVIRDTDGDWKVDFNDTTAQRVKLIDRRTASPENVGRVVVSFIAANIQRV